MRRDLALFLAWCAVLGLCLHFGRAAAPYIEAAGGAVGITLLALGALAGLGWLSWLVLRLPPEARLREAAGVLPWLALMGLIAWLQPLMIERLHVILYGVLGWLAWRLAGGWSTGLGRLGWAALLAVGVGALDEYIQHLHPLRVGDPRDVATNAASSLLAIAAARRLEP